MDIVFIGTIEFSHYCIESIIQKGGNIEAIITLPPSEDRYNSDYKDLRPIGEKHGIPVYTTLDINAPKIKKNIRQIDPDIIFVFGISQLLEEEILQIPDKGVIGSHPSLLPKGRGRHPLIWSLVRGEKQSGLSFFYMDEGTDSGDLLWQESFPIHPNDNARCLYDRMVNKAKKAIAEFLPQLEAGNAPRIPQDDSKATYNRKRTERDGVIDWTESTEIIHNLIRALSHPYPGAHTHFKGEKLTIWKSQIPVKSNHQQTNSPPKAGQIIDKSDQRLIVQTGSGLISLGKWDCRLTPERGDTLESKKGS